jgi:hypothetical protein
MRCFDSLKYVSSFSIPIKRRFVFKQPIPVVPDPIVLSSTTSPSFEYVYNKYSVRCRLLSFVNRVVFYVKFDYFVRVTGKFLGVLAVSS